MTPDELPKTKESMPLPSIDLGLGENTTHTKEDATEKKTVLHIIGKVILVLSYGLLSIDSIMFCIGLLEPSFLIVVTIWAAICIVPFILIGHVLVIFGARSKPTA